MEDIISLSKRRGFIYQGSEIYGGMAGLYDFGPYGTELLNNLKKNWWRWNVQWKDNYVGLDSAMFKDPEVWVASGHVGGFADPLSECKKCHTRIRVDKELEKIGVAADEKMSETELEEIFSANEDKIKCPNCGAKNFTSPKFFNLLVESNLGDFTGKNKTPVYLPGEACQGIYLNFKNIVDTTRMKIPFGVAQIGKAFRNEISPRNFLFRCREFEQADTQYFIRPHENVEDYKKAKQDQWNWLLSLGIREENLRWHQHEHLVFYAKDAWDIEYNYPSYGFDELMGIHDRSDYDLTQHMKFSGTDLNYTDPTTGEKFIPWILETSMGMGRMFLALLSDAYQIELNGEWFSAQALASMDREKRANILNDKNARTVLRLHKDLAPIKAAVFPLLKNKPELVAKARDIFAKCQREMPTEFDDNGNIGKRYRRQDEIGTPFSVVVDFETLDETSANFDTVAVRDRDTAKQTRVKIAKLTDYLKD